MRARRRIEGRSEGRSDGRYDRRSNGHHDGRHDGPPDGRQHRRFEHPAVGPALTVDDSAPAQHAFEDSRRLTGANRYFATAAVVLVPQGPAADDGAAHGRWIAQLLSLCAGLGWPNPQPRVHAHEAGVLLAFAAPPAAMFTATDVNEWAWERAAAGHAGHAATGFALAQPSVDDARAHFIARARAEASRPLMQLAAAAAQRGLPWLEDDDTVSIGEGSGSVVYARAALPLAMDVPWLRLHGVPKVLITGSNGKTTTTRLLAAMATAAGHTPGLCSTEGVWVGADEVARGDYAGPAGARAVLRHPAVTAALLETARGGILRRGLAVQQADVALVTNVSGDHLGEYGIDSVEDIALAKLVVAHALARAHVLAGAGTLVLNGSDDTLLRAAVRQPHAAGTHWALFARDADAPIPAALRQRGGSTCGMRAGRLVLSLHGAEHDLGAVADMPLSLAGVAGFNIENLAAAALTAALLGWPLDAVRRVLHSFGTEPQHNPGRLQRRMHRGATVLLDYAHNPEGLAQLLAVARALKPRRLGLLLGQAGNRSDEAVTALARVAAGVAPDRVVVKELPLMQRGRALGEVPALIERGLLAAGRAAERLLHEPDEEAAARALLDWAAPGDVIVLPVHTATVRERLLVLLAG